MNFVIYDYYRRQFVVTIVIRFKQTFPCLFIFQRNKCANLVLMVSHKSRYVQYIHQDIFQFSFNQSSIGWQINRQWTLKMAFRQMRWLISYFFSPFGFFWIINVMSGWLNHCCLTCIMANMWSSIYKLNVIISIS